jgi:hypothetical protein
MKLLLEIDDRLEFLRGEIAAWSAMNTVLETTSPDACLGHSYFFDALRAADNISASDDTEKICEILWCDYLLPQLTEVLTAFDAGHFLQSLETSCETSPSRTGGHWIEARGQGLDVAFIIRKRVLHGEDHKSTLAEHQSDDVPEATKTVNFNDLGLSSDH